MRPLRGRHVRALSGAALAVASLGGALLASAQHAGATSSTPVTLHVSASSGTVVTGCTTPLAPCTTIQQGIHAAATGGYTGLKVIIDVATGTYTTYTVLVTATSLHSLASLDIYGATAAATILTVPTVVTSHTSTPLEVRGFKVGHTVPATLTISGLTITHGHAQYGGAVSVLGGSVTFSNDIFSHDTALTYGGAIYNTHGHVTLTDDTFVTDHALVGGAVTNLEGTVTATDDTFMHDTADTGGAIGNLGGTLTATNDTFVHDHVAFTGGAIYNVTTSRRGGVATLSGDTFKTDTASGSGGAFYSVASTHSSTSLALTLTASLLTHSTCDGTLYTTHTVASYNVSHIYTGCWYGSTTRTASTLDLTPTLEANTSAGPATLAISPDSPALNEVPSGVCSTLKTDERGKPRPGDVTATTSSAQTHCDAGAYELQHAITTLTQATPFTGSATAGTATSFTLAVTNTTTGTVTFKATSAKVTGVTVSSAGKIAVSTSAPAGTYTLSGNDSDRLGDSGTWTFALQVAPTAPLVITTTALTSGTVGAPYTFTLAATGGTGTYTWSASGLPTGLSLTGSTGTITGTPTVTGTFTVTLTVSDPHGASATATLPLHVTPASDLGLSALADITVPATSPQGATVTYTLPTVTDPDDGTTLPKPTCTPGPGSLFAIGTTTVTCTVTDPGDPNSPVTASFTVTVQGAAAQLTQLYTAVVGIGPGTSLADIISQVQAYLTAGDITDACGTLTAFMKEIKGLLHHHQITEPLATTLITTAKRIEAVLSC